MANLGNVGRSKAVSVRQRVMYLDPSLLITGANRDYSWQRLAPTSRAFAGTNSRSKGGLHVVATITDAPAGENIGLFKNGALAEIRGAGVGGVSFYDLDDGVYYAASTESAAAWRVTVVGTVVTVEPLGGGTPMPTYGQIFPLGRG